MNSLLLVYDSSEGQTEKIARHVADVAESRGYEVELVRASDAMGRVDPTDFDAVIVGASIHVGKHQPSVIEFASEYADALAAVPAAFFEVCLSAAAGTPERDAEAERYVEEFVEVTGWDPDAVGIFAGALRYSEYGFVKTFMMKRIARDGNLDTDTSRDHEYTDWDEVTAFTTDFLDGLDAEEIEEMETGSEVEPFGEPST